MKAPAETQLGASAPEAGPFGPVLNGHTTSFRLFAPTAKHVSLLLEAGDAVAMIRTEEGFWCATCAVGAGTLYRFDVDGMKVPDPASRFQPLDVSGPSQVVSEYSYSWNNLTWIGLPWEQAIFYELHVGLLGGYNAVRGRLKDVAALGVTAIELMPIGDFAGTRNWGYDGVLPFAPDHVYGTPDELRALIDEAHGLGMMVFLDVVYNHFGPDGNWLPAYAAAFFDEAAQTPWGAAIDFHKPVVRRFFTQNALYWLQSFRFDGLRLDAVHAILDRSWLLELAAELRRQLSPRYVHLILENENNDAGLLQEGFDAQWNDDFHNVMHVLLTGESHAYYQDFATRPIEKLARCLGEGFIYQGEDSLHHPGKARGQPSAHLAPTSFVTFLQNHDQVGNRALGERLTTLANPAALRAAMALMLLCPQIPLLFMGEEWGAREPFLFFTDFHGELGDAVRDGRRREFAHSPGFGDEGATASIPDPNALSSFEMSRWSTNAPDAAAWHACVHDLIALRQKCIIPCLKESRAAGAAAVGENAVIARWHMGNGAILTIAANFGNAPVAASMPGSEPIFGALPQSGALPAATTIVWLESAT